MTIPSILTAAIAPWLPYVNTQEIKKTANGWDFPSYDVDPRIKLVEIGKSRLLNPLTKIPQNKYADTFRQVWGHYDKNSLAPKKTNNLFAPLPTQPEEITLMRKLTDIADDKLPNNGENPTSYGTPNPNRNRTALFFEKNDGLVQAEERKIYDRVALKIFREAGIGHKIIASYAVKSLVTGFIVGLAFQTFGSLIENFILPDSPRKITPDDMNTLFTNAGIDALSCGVTSALYSAGLLLFLVSPAAPMTIIVEGGLGIVVNIAIHNYLDGKFLPPQTT